MNKSKKAMLIGVFCIAVYITNYYLRNMLSVFSPELISAHGFSEPQVALLSSAYMLFYAIGQLINGFLGDFLPPKRMVLAGIGIAGVVTMLFPSAQHEWIGVLLFSLLGFALSMVRGPLMKVISENTEPKAARLICVFFSFASFAGPLIAGLIAIAFDFEVGYVIAGITAIIVALFAFVILFILEKKQIVTYNLPQKANASSLLSVFKIKNFVFYLIIACIVEISVASISFWIPTYLTNHLGFGETAANVIFTVISTCRSFMPFVTLFLFNLLRERDILLMRSSYLIASVLLFITAFVNNCWLNAAIFLISLMAMSCCSSLLWSIYIPGLGKTGRVSSVNGILDCSGYVAAAIANLFFAFVINKLGWTAMIFIWSSIGIFGILTTFLAKKESESKTE